MRRLGLALILLAAAPSRPSGAADAEKVTYLPAAQVRAAFAKGMPLLEVEGYKVHASRREGPGQAEVHLLDTDIVYVLEGTATVVTGGRVLGPHEIAPQEVRGSGIDGGASVELAPGDVLVIPDGLPHWFRDVRGPLLYYVVKVTRPEGK